MATLIIIISLLFFAFVFVVFNFIKSKKQYSSILAKYKDVIDLDTYKDKAKTEITSLEAAIQKIKEDYSQKKGVYDALIKDLSLYEDELEFTSYGLYKPHYDFQTSDQYKQRLEQIREREKGLIKNEGACVCRTEWKVNNSITEGRKQTKQYGKLMLRAFNGECDAFLANVRWNNIVKMEERVAKAFEAINKLGSVHRIEITEVYYRLKLEELRLAYEYEEKRHQEKEEQRRIQEQIREEEKAQKEIEKAMREAEDEENQYNKALDQARAELEKAKGEEVDKLSQKIGDLEKQLKEALEKKERVVSLAQITRSGHVYIISNIGSFGNDVYKIGMTRRLDPLDRVRELGDASVPFEFDIHAIIHSENAPDLEYNLQKEFEDRRINMINNRKEFFRVRIEDIEKVAKNYKADIELTKIAEARQYRESEAMREQLKKQKEGIKNEKAIQSKFPESI
jgi:hypothetical protein